MLHSCASLVGRFNEIRNKRWSLFGIVSGACEGGRS